jgi:dUTP pyrophosphatase
MEEKVMKEVVEQTVLDMFRRYGIGVPLELKVKRNELAKQFALIHTGKEGDVGYDLPTVFQLKREYANEAVYNECIKFIKRECDNDGELMSSFETAEEYNAYVQSKIWAETHESMIIQPGERILIPTGISLEIPVGHWVSLKARSSTSKLKLIVPEGVIDQGYRGELFAQVINMGTEPVIVHHGDRLVQIVMYQAVAYRTTIVEVDELASSDRGATGFGSTGSSAKVDTVGAFAIESHQKGAIGMEDIHDIDPNNVDTID